MAAKPETLEPESNETTQIETNAGETGKRKTRNSAVHPLPSERIAFSKHFPLLENAVLRSNFGKQLVASEVIEEGVAAQAAQLNVGFLVDIGLLEKKTRQYMPTEACIKFVKMLKIEQEHAKGVLRLVIRSTWFAETVVNFLVFKHTATEETLLKELGIASEVSNFDAKRPAFKILLEYLAWTGIIAHDGEQWTVGDTIETNTSSGFDESGLVQVGATPEVVSLKPQMPAVTTPVARDVMTGVLAQVPSTMTVMQRGPEWVHKAWPDCYELHFRPSPKALRLLERAVEEIKYAMSAEADTEQ